MPLISHGCTSMPREECAGGCGQTAGARMSDGKWWCADCGVHLIQPGEHSYGYDDPFEVDQYATYYNGRRYYIRYAHDTVFLLDDRQRQMPEPLPRQLRNLLREAL